MKYYLGPYIKNCIPDFPAIESGGRAKMEHYGRINIKDNIVWAGVFFDPEKGYSPRYILGLGEQDQYFPSLEEALNYLDNWLVNERDCVLLTQEQVEKVRVLL